MRKLSTRPSRRPLPPVLSMLLVCASAASCKQPTGEKPGASTSPASPARPAAKSTPATRPAKTPPKSAPASPPLPRPLAHQLPHRMTALSFLGWSADGQRFVIKTDYGHSMGELESSDRLELIEVHDTLTGKLVASFRVRRDNTTGKRDGLRSKAWSEARPRSEWTAYRAGLELTGRAPALRSADGWRLSGRPTRQVRHGEFTVTREGRQLATGWKGFAKKKLQEGLSTKETLAAYGVKGRGEPGPSIRLVATRGATSLPLLTYQVPFTYREIVECVGYTSSPGESEGRVRAFWAPKTSTVGARVLLAIHANLSGMTDEVPMNQERYYVRTLGPQIRIVADPSSEAAARALSKKLATAGLPVTELSLEGKRRDRTLVYHRGSDGAALAGRLAQGIGGPTEIAALTKPGWLRLIVLLGSAAKSPI